LKKAKICKFGLKSGNLIDRFFATRQLNGVKTSAIQNLRLKESFQFFIIKKEIMQKMKLEKVD